MSFFPVKLIFADQLPAYDRLLWEGWLPSLRKAALEWDPREQVEIMIRICEIWIPLWPLWMRENILEQVRSFCFLAILILPHIRYEIVSRNIENIEYLFSDFHGVGN